MAYVDIASFVGPGAESMSDPMTLYCKESLKGCQERTVAWFQEEERDIPALKKKLGLSMSNLDHVIAGRRHLSVACLETFCRDFMGISVNDYLLGEKKTTVLPALPSALMSAMDHISPRSRGALYTKLNGKYGAYVEDVTPLSPSGTYREIIQDRIRELAETQGRDPLRLMMTYNGCADEPVMSPFSSVVARKTLIFFAGAQDKGLMNVRIRTLLKLAVALNVSVDFLVCHDYTQVADYICYHSDEGHADPRHLVPLTDWNMIRTLSLWLRLPREHRVQMAADILSHVMHNAPSRCRPKVRADGWMLQEEEDEEEVEAAETVEEAATEGTAVETDTVED